MEEQAKKKITSRKFIIWITWLLLAIFVIGSSFFVDKVSGDIIKDTLSNFFIISVAYLGLNVGQKGIFAMKDIKSAQREEQ